MKKHIDLGTLIGADMYYDLDYDSLKGSKGNSKTFSRTSCVNDSAPSALAVASKAFQASSEEEEVGENLCGLLGVDGSATQNQQVISRVPGFVRLNPNAKYDRISIQMGNYRVNGKQNRYRRSNVYVSLRESTENEFNVFLTGAATNCKTELYRGAKNSQLVKDVIDAMYSQYPDIMIARLRYKPVDGFISDFHKSLTKSAMLGLIQRDDDFIAILFLYNEFIEIPLTYPITEKQQGKYVAHGVYDDYEEFDDE